MTRDSPLDHFFMLHEFTNPYVVPLSSQILAVIWALEAAFYYIANILGCVARPSQTSEALHVRPAHRKNRTFRRHSMPHVRPESSFGHFEQGEGGGTKQAPSLSVFQDGNRAIDDEDDVSDDRIPVSRSVLATEDAPHDSQAANQALHAKDRKEED